MTKCGIAWIVSRKLRKKRERKQNREGEREREGGGRRQDEKREIEGMKGTNDCGFAGGLDATAASARETRRWLYASGT